jgi:predicted transposase/invertase (TIGR01784 family)
MKTGDGYHVLKKTVSVLILDDTSYHSEDFHVCSRIRDYILKFELTDLLEIHILQLSKIHKQRDRDKNNTLIQWMNFLNAQTREELEMAAEANTVIKKATDILTAMSRDEEERLRYEARGQFLFDQQYTLQAAKREGRDEGITITKKEMTQRLISEGMDDQFILKITGLKIEEIQSIRNET